MNSAPLMAGVTGANGFVGKGVCAGLRFRGHQVRCLVRQAKDTRPDDAVVGDIGPETNWDQALEGLDVVVHCAAHVHQTGTAADTSARSYQRVNVAGTEHLALSAHRLGVRRLVFISSIKVLGEQTFPGHAFRHDTVPHPEDPYGASKWEAEQALHRIAAESGLEIVVIRPPLVYGPGVGANFAALVRLVAKGWPLPLGAIVNQRSLVGLGNLVDLISHCAVHTNVSGKTFLVSDGDDLSTPDLIRRIAAAMGRQPSIWPLPTALLKLAGALSGRDAQISRLMGSLQVDISETCHSLQWTPPVTIEQELTRTVASVLNAGTVPDEAVV